MSALSRTISKTMAAAILSSALVAPVIADRGDSEQSVIKNDFTASAERDGTFAAMHPAESIVRNAADELIVRLQQDKDSLRKNPDEMNTLLEETILPHFDFPYISRLILGNHWKTATEEQRERFTSAFRKSLVRTYATGLLMFANETIDYLPVVPSSRPDRVQIRTEIRGDSGKATTVDYSLYKDKQGDWKVYNVILEGINVGITYRNQYRNEIKRRGSLEKVIQNMEAERSMSPATEYIRKGSRELSLGPGMF